MFKVRILSSLSSPNFRNYFIGHTLSTLGTWIQQVVLAWLVYEITNSTMLLGVIAFFSLAPQLLIGPLAGAIIDRVNKHHLLIGIQILFFLQSLFLAYFTYLNILNSHSILILSLILGVLNAVDTPSRQSFISDIITDKNNIANALALNAMIFNCCRFIGPPIAGFLLTLTNPIFCFLSNAFSYLFLIIALAMMKNIKTKKAKGNVNQLLKQGYIYVFGNPDYRNMMFNIMILNFTASSYVAILPVFAKDYLKGNETTLGYLWGMAGIGSFIGSLFLANMRRFENIQRNIFINMMVCVIGMITLGLSNYYWSPFIALFLLGLSISISNVSTNILIQRNTPELYRGRVVSIYTALRFGFDALGGLAAGLFATWIGAKYTMALFGCFLFVYLVSTQLKKHKWIRYSN